MFFYYTYSTLKSMFSKYRHCILFYRHCGLDPQSHFVETHNYASLLYLQGIAGQVPQ